MQAFDTLQQSNAVSITNIINEWITDENVKEDALINLRGHTVTGEHLVLEPPANVKRAITICNGTLEVADGIRVKSLKGLTMENVVRLYRNKPNTFHAFLSCLFYFLETV